MAKLCCQQLPSKDVTKKRDLWWKRPNAHSTSDDPNDSNFSQDDIESDTSESESASNLPGSLVDNDEVFIFSFDADDRSNFSNIISLLMFFQWRPFRKVNTNMFKLMMFQRVVLIYALPNCYMVVLLKKLQQTQHHWFCQFRAHRHRKERRCFVVLLISHFSSGSSQTKPNLLFLWRSCIQCGWHHRRIWFKALQMLSWKPSKNFPVYDNFIYYRYLIFIHSYILVMVNNLKQCPPQMFHLTLWSRSVDLIILFLKRLLQVESHSMPRSWALY